MPSIRTQSARSLIALGVPLLALASTSLLAADIIVRDNTAATTVQMIGQTGDVTNVLAGNGLVKAWARVRADGTISTCYRCSAAPADTQRLNVGTYEVDFTPLGTNIRSRPRAAVVDSHGSGVTEGQIILANRAGDASTVFVRTTRSNGDNFDRPFTLLIY